MTIKSALTRLFNYDLNQESPVQKDYVRKVNYDEDGHEFITYEDFDYPKFQASLGCADDWKLDNLLAAGINPNFSIHTGFGTRLQGLGQLAEFEQAADAILTANENNNN